MIRTVILALFTAMLLSGCSALKVITVPVKATTSVIGGTADVID